jgi:hypothetical protein
MVANSLVDTLEDAARVHIEESYNDDLQELLSEAATSIYDALVDAFGEKPVAWIVGQYRDDGTQDYVVLEVGDFVNAMLQIREQAMDEAEAQE